MGKRGPKPKKNKGGRPTKMTEETIHRLREAYSMDCTDEEACCYASISTFTLYDYQKKHPKFSEEKQLLKQKPYLIARKSVVKGVSEDPKLALEYMKLKKNKEFTVNQNVNVSGDQENPVQIMHTVKKFEEMEDDELNRYLDSAKKD